MKLTLRHIAPYLPYGLKILSPKTLDEKGCYFKPSIHELDLSNIKDVLDFQACKLILRPMSDLTKKIKIDGIDVIPIEGMFLPCGERKILTSWANENKCWLGTQISYLVYEDLFESHFDVFGLIEQGLAIDINTLNLEV